MSGDLEDFLRRAAQRRQKKSAEPAATPPQRRRPEYSDSRRERVTEPIEVAEVVDDAVEPELIDQMGQSIAEQRKRIREAEQRAADIRAQAKKKAKAAEKTKTASDKHRVGSRSQPPPSGLVVPTRDDLIALLARPDGLRQAIMMKEILERPEHRW